MNSIRFWIVSSVLALALVLAACGGDTGTTTETEPTAAEGAAEATAPAEGGEAAPTTAPAEGGEAAPTTAPAAPTTPPADGGEAAPTTPPADGGEAAPTTPPADGGAAAPSGETVSLSIANQGEQLLFNKDSLGPVPSGSTVEVTMSNDSIVNPHNFIQLNTSDQAQVEEFVAAAEAAGESAGYIPSDTSLILASSELLAAGSSSSDTISFQAPAPGEYTYVCTVSGHYAAGMWGTLTVE
jgi:azurin